MLSLTSNDHRFGDVCNVLSVVNIGFYIIVIVAHAFQVPGVVLSPTFEKFGFCLAGDPENILMQVEMKLYLGTHLIYASDLYRVMLCAFTKTLSLQF